MTLLKHLVRVTLACVAIFVIGCGGSGTNAFSDPLKAASRDFLDALQSFNVNSLDKMMTADFTDNEFGSRATMLQKLRDFRDTGWKLTIYAREYYPAWPANPLAYDVLCIFKWESPDHNSDTLTSEAITFSFRKEGEKLLIYQRWVAGI